MHLSAMLTSLPMSFAEAASQAAALGFGFVDVVALADRPIDDLEALADCGLMVSCVSLGRGLPEGQTLDAADIGQRRAALEVIRRQLADAALLGARTGYVVPCMDTGRDAVLRFGDTLMLLAEEAGQRMIRLCLEPVPGRALPTAAGVLELLQQLNHANLAMLLDIGHCLITAEDPVAVVQKAGSLLGYVHLDDNDGVGDLHWPLLTGKLTREGLLAFLKGLQASGYGAGIGLEFNPGNVDPLAALRNGREMVMGQIPQESR